MFCTWNKVGHNRNEVLIRLTIFWTRYLKNVDKRFLLNLAIFQIKDTSLLSKRIAHFLKLLVGKLCLCHQINCLLPSFQNQGLTDIIHLTTLFRPLTYSKVKPLTVFRSVKIRPEVELVVGLCDPDNLGQVSGLKARLELETIWQGCEVNLGINGCWSWFRWSTVSRWSGYTSTEKWKKPNLKFIS